VKTTLKLALISLLLLLGATANATKMCSRLTEGFFTSGGTTTNTASISPASNSAVVVGVYAYDTLTMSVSGAGLTWTTRVNGAAASDGGRMWVFIGAGASPSSGALTLTFDEDAFVNWAVDNITGTIQIAGPSTTNVASANGTGATLSTTLGAFGNAANGVWAYGLVNDEVTLTQGSGYTLVDSNTGTAVFGFSDFSQCLDTNDTSVDATNSNAGATWSLVAIEIVDSAGGGGSSVLPIIMQQH
jgi:hypothetical protein